MIGKAALAAAFLVSLLRAPATAEVQPPAPLASALVMGTAPGGMMFEVDPDLAQSTAAVALWYRAPGSGFESPAVAGLSRLAALTVAASTPITGTSLAQLVDNFGGRLSIAAYPDSVAITVAVTPAHVEQIVRALTAVYFAPVADPAGFALAQHDVAEDALYRSYDPPDMVEDALGSILFGGGPFHDGTIATPKAVAGLTLERVRAYAERAFRPANAILVLTGNVSADAVNAAATRDGARLTPELPSVQAASSAGAAVQRTANIEGTGLGWTGPAISDEVAATSLDFLADALFAPRSGLVPRALGQLKAEVSGKFVTYHDPGLFLVTISGEDAAAALPIVARIVAQTATPMGAAAFASARAGFAYRLASDLETPAELADTFGWYAVEGNLAYAPAGSRYFTVAAGLTPQTVARVAARYLSASPATVKLVRAQAAAPAKTP